MPIWVIRSYWNERRGVFNKEFGDQPVAARMEFRATLNGLRDRPLREDWDRPDFAMLGSKYPGLGKLRFRADSVQHRPIGFFGPDSRSFTLLTWATEKDRKYRPPNIRDAAMDRMKLIIADPTRAHEFHL